MYSQLWQCVVHVGKLWLLASKVKDW